MEILLWPHVTCRRSPTFPSPWWERTVQYLAWVSLLLIPLWPLIPHSTVTTASTTDWSSHLICAAPTSFPRITGSSCIHTRLQGEWPCSCETELNRLVLTRTQAPSLCQVISMLLLRASSPSALFITSLCSWRAPQLALLLHQELPLPGGPSYQPFLR